MKRIASFIIAGCVAVVAATAGLGWWLHDRDTAEATGLTYADLGTGTVVAHLTTAGSQVVNLQPGRLYRFEVVGAWPGQAGFSASIEGWPVATGGWLDTRMVGYAG